MKIRSTLSVSTLLLTAMACSSKTPAPATQPAPARAPSPAATAAAQPAAAQPAAARGGAPAAAPAAGGAQAGGRGGQGGPPQMTAEQRAARRDSIAAVRGAVVKELMAKIAGRENEPAGTVFKNIQLMKNVPAGQLLMAMDQGFGRALSVGCDGCHLGNAWESDSLARKGRARIMLAMVNKINTDPELLPKMGPGRGGQPRAVQCVTCHRGGGAGSNALLP
jgi:hypothetical protein